MGMIFYWQEMVRNWVMVIFPFEMKDVDETSYVLGVKIIRDCAKRLHDIF